MAAMLLGWEIEYEIVLKDEVLKEVAIPLRSKWNQESGDTKYEQ